MAKVPGAGAVQGVDDRRDALTQLMTRHGDAVYRYALAMTRDRHLAEEVRQQVFVEAYRELDRTAPPSGGADGRGAPTVERIGDAAASATWIFGIARHRCLDAVNARLRWHQRYKNDPPEDPEPDAGEPAPDHALDHARLARLLGDCLAQLAPAARDAVVLRYHQDLSYDEAAAIAGDLPGTLQRRVARSLPVLRRCLEAQLHAGKPGKAAR